MLGIVAIGRNEGQRLRTCFESIPAGVPIVYVDSGSTDNSKEIALEFAAEVIDLDLAKPFTAARARNAGFVRLRQIKPDLQYVQFIDGDCSLCPTWLENAIEFLRTHDTVCAVFGRRRERDPDRSIYNQLCDWEWNEKPIGEASAFGGDVLIRARTLADSGGYRADLIAGEEPELCLRLRAAGWLVWRLDADMTMHDAAMANLNQWWRRTSRSGYAFAQGAHLHGNNPEHYRKWECRRAWIWGLGLPLCGLVLILAFGPIGAALYLVYGVQFVRQLLRNKGDLKKRTILSLFQILARFAESHGQLKFLRDRAFNRQSRLIEYK